MPWYAKWSVKTESYFKHEPSIMLQFIEMWVRFVLSCFWKKNRLPETDPQICQWMQQFKTLKIFSSFCIRWYCQGIVFVGESSSLIFLQQVLQIIKTFAVEVAKNDNGVQQRYICVSLWP